MTCGSGFGNLTRKGGLREEGFTEVVHLVLAEIAFQASLFFKKNS